jgi:hypothetical protein
VLSQSDIVPTLDFWLNGQTTLQQLQSLMFGAGFSASAVTGGVRDTLHCAFHSRGDQRGVVEVLCNRGGGEVRIDGDDTRFTASEGLSDKDRAEVLHTLASLRIEGLRRAESWEAKAGGSKQGEP